MPNSNIAKDALLTLNQVSKAQKKTEYPDALVNIAWNYTARTVTGTFVFPLQQITDDATGQVTFDVADFLIDPTVAEEQVV